MEEKNFGKLGFSFQKSLIKSIIEDRKYGENIINVLDIKYFDNNSFRFIIQNLKEYYEKYSKIPSYLTLEQKIISENTVNESYKIHLDTLTQIKNDDKDYEFVKDIALNFCKQQNLRKVLKVVDKIIDEGNFEEYNKIETIVQKALQVGIVDNETINVFDDIDDVLVDNFRQTIKTGVNGFDQILKGGLGKGELGVILAPTGTGKALPKSEPILTQYGWKEIGEIQINDDVIGSNGKTQKVTGVFPQGERKIYKIHFTDNTFSLCDGEHLWSVNTFEMRSNNDNTLKTFKTLDLINDIKVNNLFNYKLPIVEPVHFMEKKLNVEPYKMGKKLYGILNDLFNRKEKKINFDLNDYIYNSFENRLKFLNGILDKNGVIDVNGIIIYNTYSLKLSNIIKELVLSFGGSVNMFYSDDKYILNLKFQKNILPFSKQKKIKKYLSLHNYVVDKFITSITESHIEDAVCIKVSNSDELFVTRDYILTHNTTLLTKFSNTAYNDDLNVLQIFFEDNPNNIKRKHYTIWSQIAPDEQPLYSEIVKQKVNEIQSISKGNIKLLKLPSDGITITDIKNKVRKIISEGFNIDLLILDYVDCVSPSISIHGEEWKGEGNVMRSLETMATEFDIAIWTATQGNRESISSEIVTGDQMGGSIKKAHIAHVIISIAKTLEQKENKRATLTILKSRVSQDGIVFQNCQFDNEFLIINTDSQNTLLGHEELKVQERANRAAEVYKNRQLRNNDI